MSDLACEACGQPNGWALLDSKYKYCCQECYEEGLAEVGWEGPYRKVLRCSGCSIRKGAINYSEPDGGVHLFYCGTSERCFP